MTSTEKKLLRAVDRRRKAEERRKKHAAGLCEFGGCSRKVGKSRRTGKMARKCDDHLESDRIRKEAQRPYELHDEDHISIVAEARDPRTEIDGEAVTLLASTWR